MKRYALWGTLVLVGLVLVLLVAAFAFVKPVRIIAPGFFGLECFDELCTDQPEKLEQIRSLYRSSFTDVEQKLGYAPEPRRIVFCGTVECYEKFGSGESTASTIANAGIVVGPGGWQSYYVQHELIHHWQAYKLGVIERWFGPKWLMEGMAYSLSDDPRTTLVEPNQTYRASFEEWYENIGSEDILLAAENEM